MGDTLSLFAAGVAILALLFASYSRRSTWLALCSTAISMAALIGLLFVMTSHDQSLIRTRLAWVGSKLRPMLDRQTLDDLKKTAEYVSSYLSCDRRQQPGCKTTASADKPAVAPQAIQAAATPSWLEPKQDPGPAKQEPKTQEPVKQEPKKQEIKTQELKTASQYSVAWRLDEPDIQASSADADGFSISGTNVSEQALEDVHAVLKPDASQREVGLALDLEGRKVEDRKVIPAGARFRLVPEVPNKDGAKQIGGAILSFRYVQAGQSKTSILYLTPAVVGRLANRG